MDYKPLNNQGDYEVNAELKRPIDAAELKKVVDAAQRQPAGGHMAPQPEGDPIEQAIRNGFSAVCAVLRYGMQQAEKMVNLFDAKLNPGIVWEGRLYYLVKDEDSEGSCDHCALRVLCDRLLDNDDNGACMCRALTGDGDHHFVMLADESPENV